MSAFACGHFSHLSEIQNIRNALDSRVAQALLPGEPRSCPPARLSPRQAARLLEDLLGRPPRVTVDLTDLPYYQPKHWVILRKKDREYADLLYSLVSYAKKIGEEECRLVNLYLAGTSAKGAL